MKEKIEERIHDLLDAKSIAIENEKGYQIIPMPCNMTQEQASALGTLIPDRQAIDKGINHGIKVTGMDQSAKDASSALRTFFQGLMNNVEPETN